MERGKMPSTGRGGKSKAPQHPQDIFALGSKSTVVVNRDAEKRNIHKPSTSGVAERKRETSGFGTQPPVKRSRIGSPAEAVGGTSLDIDPVDLVPNVLQALDTHNSDKLLGLLTGSIRLLKSQRSKPDPILCMSMLYLTKIRPNMFAHDTVTQSLCTLLKREQGAAFKSKGNPLVFVLACNMLYAGHRDSNNWPDTFIKVYIEDALNERWWVECSWCKCLVENIATAFNTKTPPAHLIPTDNTLGTMSPSGSGSPLMGSTDEDADNTELEYSVFPRYSSSYELVEAMVLEAIKEQIQRRAAPDSIGKGFLKLLSATCGFPEIRMLSAVRLEGWLHSGKLWRSAQELLAYVCCNADACGPTAARDHEVLAQLARMRLKTKPLQAAYQACLREMVSDSPALLRSVVTHTIYNELSNVRSPNNMAVLAALIQAQPQLVPAAMAETYQELLMRPEEYLRPLRALTRECVRAARADAAALLPLARALAAPPAHEPGAEVRERAFASLADLLCLCAVVTAAHSKHVPEFRAQLCGVQAAALGWLLEVAVPVFRPPRHDYQLALNKVMFVEPADAYSKPDNWPPEAERALAYRLCCEAPLPQNTLLRLIFIGLSKDIPVSPAEVFELVEQVVKRACALPPDDNPLQVDKLELADYIFQLCQFNPPDNITLPPGYTAPALAITSLYWRGWILLTMLAAHNPHGFAERAAAAYPTLRALIEMCITGKPSIEWTVSSAEAERAEAERAAVLQLETHLAAASNAKLPITEHNSRLLSQLTTLDPLGPARKPPQLMIETLQQASQQLRLGKLLCRQPALLLDLVERHGTRRAMPWLHQLLRHDQLELSVLPVQCLCEFLSSGGEAGKAGELAAHLRRTLHDSEEGARAVLHYYLQRLAHAHAATRASAARGLRLVLAPTDAAAIATAAADWLTLLWELRHWARVRNEVVALVRAACLVECEPVHVAAYVAFLQRHVADAPLADHTALVLDLAHVLMERVSVTAAMLPAPDMPPARAHTAHRTLHALTHILYTHMRQCLVSGETEGEVEGEAGWGAGERVTLQWAHGKRASVHVTVAHAHLKLLCYGPSAFDADQEMYSWLQSVWVGREAPHAAVGDAVGDAAEDVLLPDWLRLHLVRSARPALLETGLRALPAHKLALFIQTFGMPVASMSALLSALDACPENAVVRLGVERGYMAQLLRVQRARGAQGGEAFAAALRLQDPQYPPDDALFTEAPLAEEASDAWDVPVALPLQLDRVPALLDSIFAGANAFHGDVDTAFIQLIAAVTEESASAGPFVQCACAWLERASLNPQAAAGLLQHSAHASCLLRALLPVPPARAHILRESAERLLRQYKCLSGPVVAVLLELTLKSPRDRRDLTAPSIPPNATKEQLISVLESTTPRTLEAVGQAMIESCDTQLVLDVISELLDASQQGRYDTHFKCDPEGPQEAPHVLGARGLGCGLLLDWLAELQRETLGPQPHTQMRLMFHARGAAWRPLLVALLAHRASWRTLHACLADLLRPDSGRQQWAPTALLNFAETLIDSPRICQGRDKATPKHYTPEDTLRLSHKQLEVLVRYVVAECSEAEEAAGGGLCPDGLEAARRRVEARLPLVLRCCSTPHALVAGALAAREHPMLLLLLYMRVPRVAQLLRECEERPSPRPPLEPSQTLLAAAAPSPSATDRVSHTLLTALAALSQPHSHNKELNLKLSRLESGARSLWTRVHAAGARALPLAAALLRGARHHHNMLSAIEMLSSETLFDSEEINGILECLLNMAASGGVSSSGALVHRVATLLRRYIAARPARAAQLLHAHRELIQSVPALSAVCAVWGESGPPASASPPPAALEALQRRLAPPDDLCWALQEVEAWGSRRGGAWGGPSAATALLRAAAPFAAAPQPHVRSAALALLPKLLPAVADTKPGLEVILECLDSPQPEITQSMLDKLPDLVVGLQEHASRILIRVFELGVKSRFPVEQCITKCVTTINLQRGC